jgi:hypothetical protein
LAFNQLVDGSNPSRPTTSQKKAAFAAFFVCALLGLSTIGFMPKLPNYA